MIKEELIALETEDHVKIALWKIYTVTSSKNIFLTHGTFSDKKIVLGIAEYFANLGYTCWIMEWRNHGNSSKTTQKFNFETISSFEIKTTFNYLINTLQLKGIHCITHSGGGIILTMFLIKNKEYITYINSISLFACQAFGARKNNYLKLILGKYAAYLYGHLPAKLLRLGTYNETYYTMKQWFDWNINAKFIGGNSFNYLKKMEQINIPILSICGGGDKFIAPIQGCSMYLDGFKNKANKLIVCSKENGFKEDYNHSRVLLSKNASNEIWKLVLSWISHN